MELLLLYFFILFCFLCFFNFPPCYRINDKHILIGFNNYLNKELLNVEKIFIHKYYNITEKEMQIVLKNQNLSEKEQILAVLGLYGQKQYCSSFKRHVRKTYSWFNLLVYKSILEQKEIINLENYYTNSEIDKNDDIVLGLAMIFINCIIFKALEFFGFYDLCMYVSKDIQKSAAHMNEKWIEEIYPFDEKKTVIIIESYYTTDMANRLQIMGCKIEKFNHFKNKFEKIN